MERISVAIRVKPTSRQEVSNGGQWKIVENKISLQNVFGACIKGQSYTFDKIFGSSVRNSEIYEHAKDLILSAVSGFNGTVLAYGQTSSGKTYTMQGSATDPGLIRLAIQDVFINIDKIEDREFLVRVSYMEIYNEEINDLLAPDNRKLQIYESIEKGIFVAGLREEIADSVEQVIAVLERGEAQRQFAETDMNLNSSRSHTIFRIVIESRDKSHDYKQDNDPSAQDAVRVSTLNLVDLAGSEKFSKSGAEGARSKEGAHINKSLTTLGIVINKLSVGGGKQGSHIPYRDSRLTRILQSALGGNARTAIVCTINPGEIHIDETRSTLQFASRAKRVTNCAQVNEILTDAALLKRQKEEIQELRRRLEGSPHTEDLKTEILHLRNDLLKNNRRETWCPQSTTSNTIEQSLRRASSGNDHLSRSASIEISLQPLAAQGDETFRPPLPSESLDGDEADSFWSNSSELDSLPAFGDYQNVADEDIWTRDAQEFANNADEITYENTNLQEQLNEWNFQCQEPRPFMDFEIQEKTKAAIATANIALLEEILRFRNQETKKILDLMNDMEIELKDCHLEISQLRAKNANLHEQLRARDALEQIVQDREYADEENKTIKQNLCSLETSIQDGHHQQFNGVHCLKNDFAGDELGSIAIRDVSTACHSSLNTNSGSKFQINPEENSQNWNDSKSLSVPRNASHSDKNTLTALSRACCRIEQSAGPAAENGELGRKEPTVSQEAQNLKSSLHLANRLGNELLQVLHSIENRDIRCLDGHPASKGTVGKSLEALQVLLLESANVGLRLFSSLSSKGNSLTPTELQQHNQGVANIGASAFQENCGAAGTRSKIDPGDAQLVPQGSVYSIRSTHDTANIQGMNTWSIDSMAVHKSVEQSSTWSQSLDASLPSSQDPGEDICNIDLHQACDEEPGVKLSSYGVARNMQMPDEQGSSEMNQDYRLNAQANEHFAEELEIMRSMSEAEKQFTKELLHKVKAFEAGLTVAEMEIIEYKVEIEHLKLNNLRTSLDASLHCDDWELQNLRVECEMQKEEIRQLMEQVMTTDDELERESLLRETMERNNFLENCLREAEVRLLKAKDWLEELLQLRDAEIQREFVQKSHHGDNQARSAALEKGVIFWQGMSKEGRALDAQLSKDCDSRERLIEVSKSGSLIEPIARKFQLLSSGSAKNRASFPTLSRKLDTMTTRNLEGMEHLRGRPPRPALRNLQQNLFQPCAPDDLGGYTRGDPDIKKLHAGDQSEKENQPRPRFPYTASK